MAGAGVAGGLGGLGVAGASLAVATTVALTVYGQLILRWQVAAAGAPPADAAGRIAFLGGLLLQPWVVSAVVATFLAGLTWMLALTRFELSAAYPWTSLTFVIVLAIGVAFLGEQLNAGKVVGTLLVVAGLVVLARSA